MPDGAALGLTTFLFVDILVAFIWLIIPTVSEQMEELQESIPESIETLRESIEDTNGGNS